MIPEEEATVQSKQLKVAHPYLELHLLLADGREQWLQLQNDPLRLVSYLGPEWDWFIQLQGDQVCCQSSDSSLGASLRGVQVRRAVLAAGDCLELGQHRLWLMDARLPEVAWLEAWPGTDGALTWNLKPQAYRIGRRGQTRLNHVELNHPTVSRAQATLLPMHTERFGLMAESSSSPTRINGLEVQLGEVVLLHHGDLIQLGEVSLRFRQSGQAALGKRMLRVQSLAAFSVRWGELKIPSVLWKVEKTRVLMARLAWSWEEPLAVDELVHLLWPDQSVQRGRKNLSHCLGELRATLQLSQEQDLLWRSSSSIQINPSVLGEHDARALLALAQGQEISGWVKALQLYGGPYLPGFGEDWALEVRERLHSTVVGVCLKLALAHAQNSQWELSFQVAVRGLSLDSCHQGLAEVAMDSSLRLNRPEEAIRCFQELSTRLSKRYDIEPSTELVRLFMRAKGSSV
ncbi:MAG: BTAD domain-containing putative transcriptional regulator [Vulcanimicrobiota bacterium]